MTPHPLVHSLVLAALLMAGCVPVSHTYDVRRSALVPSIAPPMRSGRPIDGRVDVAAHAGTNLTAAGTEANGTSSMYVARTTLGTAARFRIGRVFDIGPVFQAGLGGGAMPAGPSVPEEPEGNAMGTGLSMQIAPRFDDERFGLAALLDLTLFSVPLREEWWCLDCGGAPMLDHTETTTELVPVFGLALLPSYQPSRTVTFFGGLTLRNQPVVRGSETVVTDVAGLGDSKQDLEVGPLSFVASLGAELTLGAGAHAMLVLSQPLSQSPVQYGPALSTALAWSFGEPAPR